MVVVGRKAQRVFDVRRRPEGLRYLFPGGPLNDELSSRERLRTVGSGETQTLYDK